ncbi:tigger transposable element-derived protein 4-like [Plakobranchus ocellatus]|uniref:Tigger transposable element-derived protein 4-like n=1 Tax=Plakobranchus ocellatus TaxID=259542 RepID=A0AAV4B0A5_9GAST|nr:tigger transposable element-derived protein 4-like [Plakobranchus ocellatus]
MIVDNCPAHPSVDNMKAIKLVFLPPKHHQYFRALDQGIINSFKRNYRKAVAQRYLVHIDTGCPDTFNISVLQALYLMKKAWDDISTSAIANCFRYAGFYSQEESSETESETSQENRDLVFLFDRLKGVVPVDGTLGAFLSIDDDVSTAEETSIQQIAADLREDKSESEEDEEATSPTTAPEARSTLLTF